MSKSQFPLINAEEINCLSLIPFRVYEAYEFYSISNSMKAYYSNRTGYIQLKLIYNALAKIKAFTSCELLLPSHKL